MLLGVLAVARPGRGAYNVGSMEKFIVHNRPRVRSTAPTRHRRGSVPKQS